MSRYIRIALVAVVLLAGVGSVSAEPITTISPQDASVILNSKDFGVIADGKHNNFSALQKMAEKAVAAKGRPVVMNFPANGRIYADYSGGDSWNKVLFVLSNIQGITLNGNGSTFVLGKNTRFMDIMHCSDAVFKNLSVTYQPGVAVNARVVAVGPRTSYIDVKAENTEEQGEICRNIAAEMKKSPAYFCMFEVKQKYRTVIPHFSPLRAETDTPTKGTTRVYKKSMDKKYIPVLKKGTRIAFPRPGLGQLRGQLWIIKHNRSVRVEDVTIHGAPMFVFVISQNEGSVLFKNTKIMPEKGNFVASWRDAFHTKANRAQITFDGITVMGNGDDNFNFCTMMKKISAVNSPVKVELRQVLPQNFVPMRKGDTVVFLKEGVGGNSNNKKGRNPKYGGAYIGEAKIAAYAEKGNKSNPTIVLTLDKPVKGLVVGAGAWSRENANPGVVLKNSVVRGSSRIQGSVTYRNCDIVGVHHSYALFYEGAGPEYIDFENCTFKKGQNLGQSAFRVHVGGDEDPALCTLKKILVKNCKFYGDFKIKKAGQIILEGNEFYDGTVVIGEATSLVEKNNKVNGTVRKIQLQSEITVE